MTFWEAVIVAGFCGAVLVLVEIAPRLSGRHREEPGTATPPGNDQHVHDEQTGAP
ncbi:hypothetical protein ACFWPP_11655 [Streptomyces anulatus]|uniref:hypothetical protein n=1 Tax=Streptomyces anulatus TaxID=1892 RepID=UPI003646F8C6